MRNEPKTDSDNTANRTSERSTSKITNANPLKGRALYRDDAREVSRLAATQPELQAIAKQPGTTWLTGPSASDPVASKDIETVKRTTAAAAKQDAVTMYQLYAIPDRDACAPYSNGGFKTGADYLDWIRRIVASLEADAAFAVEADAIAHTLQAGCMSPAQVTERLALIAETVKLLQASPRVIGVYLDAGHSEWFPDPTVLVGPLSRAGVAEATGVAVNVSNFVATPVVTQWAQQLLLALPTTTDRHHGAIIDTSRNGKGVPPASVTGDARWCNPAGRGLGKAPSTTVGVASIDAYFWGKNPGESDGNCFGNPPAGAFNLPKALELIRNAEN
jgi:endoglucanase